MAIARLAAVVAVLCALLVACGPVRRLDTPLDRRKTIDALLPSIASHRDQDPHNNPAFAQIDPAWIDSFIAADTAADRFTAFVTLVDQLDDGHALCKTCHGLRYGPFRKLGRIDGRTCIDCSPIPPLDASAMDSVLSERFVAELVAADGCRPQQLLAAYLLLRAHTDALARILARVVSSERPGEFLLGRGRNPFVL